MSPLAWILVSMWAAYGISTVVIAFKNTGHAVGYGIITGIFLAYFTMLISTLLK